MKVLFVFVFFVLFCFVLEECANSNGAGRALRSLTAFVSVIAGFHGYGNDHRG